MKGKWDEPPQELLDEWNLFRVMQLTGVPMWKLKNVSHYWINRVLGFSEIQNEALKRLREHE